MICTLQELKDLFGGISGKEDASIAVDAVSTDTRTIRPGSVFVAVKGENFDGHDFALKALEQGAVTAVVRRGSLPSRPGLIEVEDTVEAYGRIANLYRRRCGFQVVAITGSSGKTTTKDMVEAVLSKRFRVVKTFRNNNNEIGVPFTILNASPDTEILVLEMGMRALGEIAALARVAEPDVGIITNIGIAHIGELGSRENILRAKGELFEALPPHALAIFNGEDGFDGPLSARFDGEKRVFGFGENAGIRAAEVREEEGATRFRLERDGAATPLTLPYAGRHLLLDSLIAIETGLHYGVPAEEAADALSRLEGTPGRLERIQREGWLIINDSYNANPESMKASLEVLAGYPGRKIAVLGDMKELGEDEAAYHREIGRAAVEDGIDYLICQGNLAAETAAEARIHGMPPDHVFATESHRESAESLKPLLVDGAVVLFKGSRAMAMEKVIECLED